MFHGAALKRISIVTSGLALCLGGVMGAAVSASAAPAGGAGSLAGGAVAPSSFHFGRTTPICDGDDNQTSWNGPFSFIKFVRTSDDTFTGTLYTTEPNGGDKNPGNPVSNGSWTYNC